MRICSRPSLASSRSILLVALVVVRTFSPSTVSAFTPSLTTKTCQTDVGRSMVCSHGQRSAAGRTTRLASGAGDGNYDDDDDDDDDNMDDDTIHHYQNASPVTVWVEDAESGFVDADDNLEDGEICLRAVKAFASPPPSPSTSVTTLKFNDYSDEEEQQDKRFLCAGALVRRPLTTMVDEESNAGSQQSSLSSTSSSRICDVWIADSILDDGGPNLQIQGAAQVLDTLFLDFLVREQNGNNNNSGINNDDSDNKDQAVNNTDLSIECLRNFIVHCGENLDQDHTCASFMAAQTMRGFVPLRDAVRQNSIYSRSHYGYYYYYYDLDGMVFDPTVGIQRYKEAFEKNQNQDEPPHHRTTAEETNSSTIVVRQILHLLPDEETIHRHTIKRFTLDR